MKIDHELLKIEYPSGETAYLSETLVKRQKLTHHAILLIKQLHLKKDHLYSKMRGIMPNSGNSIQALKALDEQVTANEFELQKAWGFDLSANMHPWYQVPHCKCPKMDNHDLKGTDQRIIDPACPIHSEQ